MNRREIIMGLASALQATAPSFEVELHPIDARDAAEIKRSITSHAVPERRPDANPSPDAAQSSTIIRLATLHRSPSIYGDRMLTADAGLISYGPDPLAPLGQPPGNSTASSRARSQSTCRCRRQPSTNLSSISRRVKALNLEIPCSPAPTR